VTATTIQRTKVPAGKSAKLPLVCTVPTNVREEVIAAVCDQRVFATTGSEVCGNRRTRAIVPARAMVIFILRAAWGDALWTGEEPLDWATFQQIGRVVYREYTTAMHAYELARTQIQRDAQYRRRLITALDLVARNLPPRHFQRVMLVRERIATQ
jgi:hypothetical protein